MESLNHELFEFEKFKSIPRLTREMVVSEKLDGTNAQIVIGSKFMFEQSANIPPFLAVGETAIAAGSKNRWITPQDDNYGFARWVYENADVLTVALGEGRHYGEWWGQGIQRGYNMKRKMFSLFNAHRWATEELPDGVGMVPVLYEGEFCTQKVDEILQTLSETGSVASPGFMNPEGVVVFHKHSNGLFKKTLDKNDQHKWQV